MVPLLGERAEEGPSRQRFPKIHQPSNGLGLLAKRPTSGSADICLRWDGIIEDAVAAVDRARG